MCGIFAILCLNKNNFDINIFEKMSQSLIHRGPDDCGYVFFELFGNKEILETNYIDENIQNKVFKYNGILALGHRRLSIIDLSETGHQPMHNEDRNIWVIFNGEIYNYKELTEELKSKGHYFHSKTDTEVILHAYEEWGVECVRYFNGMWAFALWDIKRNKLFCSRDRFGIKPLYYYFDENKLILTSEIKAILQDIKIKRIVNINRTFDYLTYGYLDHTEDTFFKNIKQLRGAHYLIINIKDKELYLDIKQYWDLKPKEIKCDYPYAKRFLDLFNDSIRLHIRSDVPIGTCLSGGLDSSSIVCVAHKYHNAIVHKTFSSCFVDERYDERNYIKEVIKVTKAEPFYVFPDSKRLFDDIDDIIWYQEEPFGSTSIYAQWCVFKLAKEQGIKVVLDGQGADELLGGYHSYYGFYLGQLLKEGSFKRFIHEYKSIKALHKYSDIWILRNIIFSLFPKVLYERVKKRIILYQHKWLKEYKSNYLENGFKDKYKSIFHNRLYHSLVNYSLPGLLHYEDRNSMAHSIEARVPFLDYRLVEYVYSLPINQFIKGGMTKYVLRKAMHGILPNKIRWRKDKMGFGTPEGDWFRIELKNQIYDIINSKSFAERGFFNVKKIKEHYKKHCEGKINISSFIWRWINVELWLRKFIDNQPTIR